MLALHLGCLLLAANASQPSKADQALFTWFDKLGHTQALKNELVVVMGSQGYGGIWAMDRPGFVVNESPGRMRILTAAMESVPWIVGNDVVLNASAQRDVDLRAVVQERLKSNESDHYRYNDTSGVLDYFLFGRACYLRGFRTEGSKILGLAHKNAAKRHLDFADAIKKWCDDGEFQQTRSAIATPRAPLSSFIGAYLTYLRRFPKGRHVTEVTHDLSILDWMVDEEKKHPDWLTKPIGQFKPDQQAAKLVYRLRRMDGSGSELYQPSKLAGGYDVEGVLNEGMNGVPALLAALDDPSFSRRYNGINKSPYVMGELAAIVLEQLSGEELTYYPWELPDDDKRASMRARIAKWQRSLQPPKSPTDHPIVDLAGEGELSKEIRSGKTLASRMNAALQFALIDRRKAADSVRPQWKYLNTEAEGTDGLIRFMAKYAGADGIQELAGDFRSLVSSDRSTILHELAAPGPEPVPQYSKGELAALVKSRRQLLVEGLGDDQVVP